MSAEVRPVSTTLSGRTTQADESFEEFNNESPVQVRRSLPGSMDSRNAFLLTRSPNLPTSCGAAQAAPLTGSTAKSDTLHDAPETEELPPQRRPSALPSGPEEMPARAPAAPPGGPGRPRHPQ